MRFSSEQLRGFRDRAWSLPEQVQAAECVRLARDGNAAALLGMVEALFEARRVLGGRDGDEEAQHLRDLVALRAKVSRFNEAARARLGDALAEGGR